jgi:hypothetical protein
VRRATKIAEWYRGKPVEGGQHVVFLNSYRQHWTARWAQAIVGFGQRYWVGGAFIALIALVYAIKELV